MPPNALFTYCVKSPSEILLILNELDGRDRLIIERFYGNELRVSDCLRLRIQDIDFKIENASLTVRDDKDHKDRQTILSHKCEVAPSYTCYYIGQCDNGFVFTLPESKCI